MLAPAAYFPAAVVPEYTPGTISGSQLTVDDGCAVRLGSSGRAVPLLGVSVGWIESANHDRRT